MTKEFHAVMEGTNTIFVGLIKEKNGTMFVRQSNPIFPFIKKWRPAFGHISELLKYYKEKRIVNLIDGITDNVARKYPIDLIEGKIDFTDVDIELRRELASIRKERDFLHSKVMNIERSMTTNGIKQMFMSEFKNDYDFYTNLRPPQVIGAMKDKKDKKK